MNPVLKVAILYHITSYLCVFYYYNPKIDYIKVVVWYEDIRIFFVVLCINYYKYHCNICLFALSGAASIMKSILNGSTI